jgi:hypothetical protein
MKYIQSLKFSALGIVLASAVAVATATPSLATPHVFVPDHGGGSTGPGTSDMGPSDMGPSDMGPSDMGPSDSHPTGPGSGSSLHPGVKKEMHYSLNKHQTAACKTLIAKLREDHKAAVTPSQKHTFFKSTLPAARQAYFKIVSAGDAGRSYGQPGTQGSKGAKGDSRAW